MAYMIMAHIGHSTGRVSMRQKRHRVQRGMDPLLDEEDSDREVCSDRELAKGARRVSARVSARAVYGT